MSGLVAHAATVGEVLTVAERLRLDCRLRRLVVRNVCVFYDVAFESLVVERREWVVRLLKVVGLAHSLGRFVLFLDALLTKLALRLLLNLMRLVLVLRKAAAIVLAVGTSLPTSLLGPQFVVRFIRIFEAHIASCLTLRQSLLAMKIRADVI